MTQTTARINQAGKHFEILVDMEKALEFKKGGTSNDFLEIDKIFKDSKKGEAASGSDMKDSFGTEDVQEVSERIVKNGEILLTQGHRDEERDKKVKQVVDFLTVNSIDSQTGNPHSAERIKNALNEAHVNIKNGPIDSQIKDILAELSKVIPIKIETKKIKLTIPAMHTGKAYRVINQYKESENWLPNGDLETLINVPAGLIMEFYDKINSITQGSVLSEEIKE